MRNSGHLFSDYLMGGKQCCGQFFDEGVDHGLGQAKLVSAMERRHHIFDQLGYPAAGRTKICPAGQTSETKFLIT